MLFRSQALIKLQSTQSALTARPPSQPSDPHFQIFTDTTLKSFTSEASIGQGKEMIKKGLH